MRCQDPDGVHSPFAKSDVHTRYKLPLASEWGHVDYEEWILENLEYETEVRFLKRGGSDESECDGRNGSEMIKETNARRSFLEKMGYVVREDLYDIVSIASIGYNEMAVYLAGNYKAVCRYTVVEDIPTWYAHVPGVL
jgi:hypothetical protein